MVTNDEFSINSQNMGVYRAIMMLHIATSHLWGLAMATWLIRTRTPLGWNVLSLLDFLNRLFEYAPPSSV
jgi:hypothetical protein